ncbi:FliG C-terminal domain-containing protein [Neorhodopirellula pilleata]|uniref:Flagellar motor switch protein G n=1 Tax=Neorhodopirellula pilleata TaxID=2714738 RepID=A0A5C6AS48_9BACT|nr:FliG C-terminal domain-containing protein [Neorhodopirellula pilleata]TWU02089.1 flagellar motor switch protein G [Neorhodopirellula pilleata]
MSLNALAANTENEARRAASLRRIAIVLRDLPEPVALKLLADLGPEARRRVQRELRTLIDVDPMERKRALESFTGSIKRQAAREADHRLPPDTQNSLLSDNHRAAIDRLTDEPVDRRNQPESTTKPSRPLGFLDQVADEDLLTLLQDEHPQTKAVVFASIEPSRAARILPRLGNAQRQDMLSRIGRLQSLPDEMLADLAGSFQNRVQRIQTARDRNPLQQLIDQNAIDYPGDHAVWNPADAAKHVPRSAVAVSPRLQAILAELPSSAPDPIPEEEASQVAARLRQITRETEPTAPTQTSDKVTVSRPTLSTDQIHLELVRLAPKRLCEALARVETRVAILALCGLPNQTADAAIACLPRAAANQVRRQLMSLGSMEIREIDLAKEAVAIAAQVIHSTHAVQATAPDGVSQHSTRLAA